MKILNIAAGKFDPLIHPVTESTIPMYILNVDTSYYSESKAANTEWHIESWEDDPDRITTKEYLNMDVFEFMERTRIMFDRVVIYRFLEHVSFTQIDYFIYLVSTVLKEGGTVDIIVPNYDLLAIKIVEEQSNIEQVHFGAYDDFEGYNTELTTELLNEPSCPHASIWTPYRAKKFWEREKRFTVDTESLDPRFEFDGRNIYLRFYARRI